MSETTVSKYARFFDEANRYWDKLDKNGDYNRMFLRVQENYFNDLLKARGFVFLNEVYNALGFEWTRDGQQAGWVIKGADKPLVYISFNIPTGPTEHDKSILIDFNAEEDIYSRAFGD